MRQMHAGHGITFVMVKGMKTSLVLSVLMAPLIMMAGASAHADVMSFKDWKTARVSEAKQNFDKMQAEMAAIATPAPLEARAVVSNPVAGTGQVKSPRMPRNEARLQQARLSLEIAQELNASDYFSLYLSQLKNPSDFQDATHKLSPDEVTEILTSVRRQSSSQSRSENALPPLVVPAAESSSRSL